MSENNVVVCDILMETFVFAFMVALIPGLCWAGALAEFDGMCELIAYVIIGGSLGAWAAYGRYLMKYYWEDEEE